MKNRRQVANFDVIKLPVFDKILWKTRRNEGFQCVSYIDHQKRGGLHKLCIAPANHPYSTLGIQTGGLYCKFRSGLSSGLG